MRGPLVFATLAMLLGTVPFLFLGRLVTAFSRPLVLAFAVAVLASMVVSFLLTPALGVLLLVARMGGTASAGRPAGPGARRIFDRAARRARAAAAARGRWPACWRSPSSRHPAATGNSSLLPALQDRNLLLQRRGGPGHLADRDGPHHRDGRQRAARPCPGSTSVGAHVGRAIGSDQLVNVNSGEVWVTLDDRADYASDHGGDRARSMHGYPGLRTDLVDLPRATACGQVTADQRDDLVVRVYGADLDRAASTRPSEVRGDADRGSPAWRTRWCDPIPQQPTVEIEVNLAAAQKYGLRPGDVRRATRPRSARA